ncbi:integrase catalytic subunit [Halomonas sp. HAL1]|nr:integrase catalytic subunit [Halomonas sp. HAL1]
MEWRDKPYSVRCDNGPEYISDNLTKWAESRSIQLIFIQLGKPQQNAYIERCVTTCLAQYLFKSIKEAQGYSTNRLWLSNNERPHMGLSLDFSQG